MQAEYKLTPVPVFHRPTNARLAALRDFTRTVVAKRGLAAGYCERKITEVVLPIAVKPLSNYANHLFRTPVDGIFAGGAWSD